MYLQAYIKPVWHDLQIFIEVETTREELNGQTSVTKRYYITSLILKKVNVICRAIRLHWHVENRLHWKLDVGMQEDACRIFHPQATENFSTLRKIVLGLLEKDNATQGGIAFKQWKAALNTDYLQKVIGF